MRSLKMLYIRPNGRASVEFMGAFGDCSFDSPLCIPVLSEPCVSELSFSVWPDHTEAGVAVPQMHFISLEAGRPLSSDVTLIDWGFALEAMPMLKYIPEPDPALAELSSLTENGSRFSLLRFGSDCALTVSGREGFAFVPCGKALSGSLRIVDFGSARLLCCQTEYQGSERLRVFDFSAARLLDISGITARIENGVPVSVEPLDTIMGHEKRMTYDFRGGKFRVTGEETGFFTHEAHEPQTQAQIARALFESASLGLADDSGRFISPSLAGSLDTESLLSFTGPFSKVLIPPMEDEPGSVTVGLADGLSGVVTPRLFRVRFEDGLVSDIEEL